MTIDNQLKYPEGKTYKEADMTQSDEAFRMALELQAMKEIADGGPMAKGAEVLLDAMRTGDSSGAIERQEARGQDAVVNSEMLPKEISRQWVGEGADKRMETAEEAQARFEALGFVFGEEVNDLFRKVQLPEGWTKRGTSHSMHSEILDERGVKRVGVFYKAAFYDERADMHTVNVGGEIASKFFYHEPGDPGDAPYVPTSLTDAEYAEIVASCHAMLKRAERHEHYQDRVPRAEALLKLLAERGVDVNEPPGMDDAEYY